MPMYFMPKTEIPRLGREVFKGKNSGRYCGERIPVMRRGRGVNRSVIAELDRSAAPNGGLILILTELINFMT